MKQKNKLSIKYLTGFTPLQIDPLNDTVNGNAGVKILPKRHFLSVTGFTLLEILIVVVIVGILASLAIPRYQKTIERAKGAEAYANLGILRGAILRYWGEYDTLIPDGTLGLSLLDIESPNSNPNSYFMYGVSATDPDTGHFVVWASRKEDSAYPFHYLVMDLTGAITSPPWPPGQVEVPEGCGSCH